MDSVGWLFLEQVKGAGAQAKGYNCRRQAQMPGAVRRQASGRKWEEQRPVSGCCTRPS